VFSDIRDLQVITGYRNHVCLYAIVLEKHILFLLHRDVYKALITVIIGYYTGIIYLDVNKMKHETN